MNTESRLRSFNRENHPSENPQNLTQIGPSDSKLLPIAAAFEIVTGSRPSPPTIWRWKQKGQKGVPLPYVQIGGVAKISVSETRRWITEVTTVTQSRNLQIATSSPQTSSQAAATARLARVLNSKSIDNPID